MRLMDHDHISEQAEDVATLLRSLLRGLSVGLDDPAVDLPLAQLRVCTVLYGGPRPCRRSAANWASP